MYEFCIVGKKCTRKKASMEYNTDTLIALAELTIAFVAFVVIVSSLRITSGEKLTPFEIMLVQFFTESGLLLFSVTTFPLVLFEFLSDESFIANIACWYTLILLAIYFPFYFLRRSKIDAPRNIPLLISTGGWLCVVVALGMTVTGAFWEPSLGIIVATVFWGLSSFSLIFLAALSSFVGSNR